MSEIKINIADDFSKYPSGRVISDGPNSGERFRKEILLPALRKTGTIILILDGVNGYPSSFSEEAFGGLVREKHCTAEELLERLDIQYDSNAYEAYAEDIKFFIEEAEKKPK